MKLYYTVAAFFQDHGSTVYTFSSYSPVPLVHCMSNYQGNLEELKSLIFLHPEIYDTQISLIPKNASENVFKLREFIDTFLAEHKNATFNLLLYVGTSDDRWTEYYGPCFRGFNKSNLNHVLDHPTVIDI